jgi:hypothetical protein
MLLTSEQQIVKKIKQMSINKAISQLHENGFSITKSILLLKIAHQMNLRDAKAVVSNHPIWTKIVQMAQPLHEELINNTDKIFSFQDENLSEIRIEKRIVFN